MINAFTQNPRNRSTAYRAPLPLVQSGVLAGISDAESNNDYVNAQAQAQRRYAYLDSGLGQNGQADAANPYGDYQRATEGSRSMSANHGFGYSGRIAEQSMLQPHYEIRSALDRKLKALQMQQEQSANQLQQTNANAGITATAYGVNQGLFARGRRDAMRNARMLGL
jgi:hypothetical protein